MHLIKRNQARLYANLQLEKSPWKVTSLCRLQTNTELVLLYLIQDIHVVQRNAFIYTELTSVILVGQGIQR